MVQWYWLIVAFLTGSASGGVAAFMLLALLQTGKEQDSAADAVNQKGVSK